MVSTILSTKTSESTISSSTISSFHCIQKCRERKKMTSLGGLLRAVQTCTKKYSQMGRQAGAGWQVTQKATERIQFFLLLHSSICVRSGISKNEECHLQQLFQITRNPVWLHNLRFISLTNLNVLSMFEKIFSLKILMSFWQFVWVKNFVFPDLFPW